MNLEMLKATGTTCDVTYQMLGGSYEPSADSSPVS